MHDSAINGTLPANINSIETIQLASHPSLGYVPAGAKINAEGSPEMRLLSYPLGPATPTYADNPRVELRPVSLIEDGGVANWFELRTINHNGTHVDAPWHFNPSGPKLTDLDCTWYVYDRPVIVDVPKRPGELIGEADLQPNREQLADADMALVRTGFGSEFRSSDPVTYGTKAPGFDPSAARFFHHLPYLRAVIMDIPSAGSPLHRDAGDEFHRIMLGRNAHDRFILLVEDARLEPDLDAIHCERVIVAPLLLQDADGAPVTVLAESGTER